MGRTRGSRAYRVSADEIDLVTRIVQSYTEAIDPALTVSGVIGLLTVSNPNNPMSKSSYGVRTPKHSARSRREQPANQETTDETTVEPACRTREVGRGVEERKWRETAYHGATRAFFDACKWCFPGGAPDENEIETVVRSCRKPTTYHRQRNNTNASEREHQTDGTKPRDHPQISQEPIESITDLRVGQWIEIEYLEHSLYVVKATTETDGTVGIRGPNGGEYQIESRPDCPQPYYGSKTGYLSEIIRIRIEIPLEAV